MQDATELDVKTVGCYGGGPDADSSCGGVWLTSGNGHDLGLRIPVVAYVVGHGHAAATGDGCSGYGGGRTAAAVIIVITTTDAAVVVAVGRTATAIGALRVSGVGGNGRGAMH